MSTRIEGGIDWNAISQIQQLLPADTSVSTLIQTDLPSFWDLLQQPITERPTTLPSARPDFWNKLTFKVEQFVLEVLLARREQNLPRIVTLVDRFQSALLHKNHALPLDEKNALLLLVRDIVSVVCDLRTAPRMDATSATTSTTTRPTQPVTPLASGFQPMEIVSRRHIHEKRQAVWRTGSDSEDEPENKRPSSLEDGAPAAPQDSSFLSIGDMK